MIPSCIFKICQIVEIISVTSQFHKFLYVIFGGFCYLKPARVVAEAARNMIRASFRTMAAMTAAAAEEW